MEYEVLKRILDCSFGLPSHRLSLNRAVLSRLHFELANTAECGALVLKREAILTHVCLFATGSFVSRLDGQASILAEQNARAKALYGRDPSKKKPKGPQRAVRHRFLGRNS